MTNRLLIISSSSSKQFLLADLLSAFRSVRQPFLLFAKAKRLLRRAEAEKWQYKKFSLPTWPFILFIIFLPWFWFLFGLSFLVSLWRYKPKTIILVNWPEKIIFSRFIKTSKIKLFWLEYPERDLTKASRIFKFFYRRFSKQAEFIVFGNKSKEDILSVVGDRKIEVILPSVLANNYKQHSIFKTLAELANRGRFVVGSVLYGLPRDQAERLLSALSIVESVCPTIELVIVGEGKNRKQIQWLARRMKLERKIWLAGPTSDFQRWVGQFDVYVMANKKPSLEDSAWAISAMTTGLPVIGPKEAWLEDIINEKNGALLDINDPEILARQLINWQQDNEICKKLGQESRELAHKLSFDNFVNSFIKLLS